MLRTPESGSASCKVGNIVVALESDSGKINNHNLIAHLLRFPAEYVVNFDVPVGDVVVVQILDPVAQFNHNHPHNVPEIVSFVLLPHVVHHLLVSAVALVQLAPVHQLS